MRQRRAGLERAARDARDDEPAADDMRGFRESCVSAGLVPEKGLHEEVVRTGIPDERRVGSGGGRGVGDRRQRLVVDEHRLGRVLRPSLRLGHDHRHGLAHIPRLVDRQQRVVAHEDLGSAGAVQLEIEPGLRQRAVVELAEPVRRAVRPGEDGEHAGQGERRARVDRDDPRVRMRRTHHRGVDLARQGEVVGETAPAGQQARILPAPDRPADGPQVFDATPVA